MKSSFQAAVLLSSIFFSSCVFAVGTGSDEDDVADWRMGKTKHVEHASSMTADSPKVPVDKKSDEKPGKKVDMEALGFDLMMAELEFQAAQASHERAMEAAQYGITTAQRSLDLAKEELAHFENVEMPLAGAESDLSLDRTRGRLDDSKAELQQLVDMYADEEFAESTKELVLTRGKRGVEQSERSLELAEKRAEDKHSFELSRKADAFAFKVAEAERNLKLKVDALATAELDGKTKMLRAENKVEKAKTKLEEAAAEAN